MPFTPESIYIEAGAENYALTHKVLRRFWDRPVVYGARPQLVMKDINMNYLDVFGAAKRQLLLSCYKGSFLKKCPGVSPGMVCCNYFIVNLMSNCVYDCSYCFLQDFLQNNALLQAFVNIEDVLEELEIAFSENPESFYRVGTGEIADSLALDDILPYTDFLIPFFNRRENAVLELKTKSAQIGNLLKHDPRNVIVSWSINPPFVVNREEKFTASLTERLEAARLCQNHGFRVGMHFDPIIIFPGWERAYAYTVDKMFSILESKSIEWISLGGFRYRPNLKSVIQERHPETHLFNEEQVVGGDGKFRYLRNLRNLAFETIRRFIKNHNSKSNIYLCMEPKEIWEDVTGALPREDKNLDPFFKLRA